jgi:hypothetical protein
MLLGQEMRIVRDALSIALVVSGWLGLEILANDTWLWSAAPSHAYGLTVFVAIDMALALTLFIRINLATIGAVLIATAQLGAMLADTAVGQPQGIGSRVFSMYLFSDSSYIALVVVQVGILLVAIVPSAISLFHKHGRQVFFAHPQPR